MTQINSYNYINKKWKGDITYEHINIKAMYWKSNSQIAQTANGLKMQIAQIVQIDQIAQTNNFWRIIKEQTWM